MLDPRLLAALAMLAACCAHPAAACDGLNEGPGGVVTSVFDGRTVELDSGITVRLLGLRAPVPAGRDAAAIAEPMTDTATTMLTKLLLHQPVRLGLDDEETDRYGHMEAELFIDAPNGIWVQHEMVAAGMARVEVLPKGRRCMAELIAAEAVARSNGVGIWTDPYYSLRDAGDPETLKADAGKYELVEGEIASTGDVRGRVYLDFGRVWKDDVTATIEQKARGLFAAAGIDLLSLKGQRVRLRGWVEDHDGPLIELSLPEQLEVLTAK